MEAEQTKKTAEAIQKAKNTFALDLPTLVEETARDVNILTQSQPWNLIKLRASLTPIGPIEAILLLDSVCYFTMTKL